MLAVSPTNLSRVQCIPTFVVSTDDVCQAIRYGYAADKILQNNVVDDKGDTESQVSLGLDGEIANDRATARRMSRYDNNLPPLLETTLSLTIN